MKIRNGFVSNSSSSSFLICAGGFIDNYDLNEDLEKLEKYGVPKAVVESLIEDVNLDFEEDDYTERLNYIKKVMEANGLQVDFTEEGLVFGIRLIAEFSQDIDEMINELKDLSEEMEQLGVDRRCRTVFTDYICS